MSRGRTALRGQGRERRVQPGRHLAASAVRELLRAGLTTRDVAEIFRAHPRAIEELAATEQEAPLRRGSSAASDSR